VAIFNAKWVKSGHTEVLFENKDKIAHAISTEDFDARVTFKQSE